MGHLKKRLERRRHFRESLIVAFGLDKLSSLCRKVTKQNGQRLQNSLQRPLQPWSLQLRRQCQLLLHNKKPRYKHAKLIPSDCWHERCLHLRVELSYWPDVACKSLCITTFCLMWICTMNSLYPQSLCPNAQSMVLPSQKMTYDATFANLAAPIS